MAEERKLYRPIFRRLKNPSKNSCQGKLQRSREYSCMKFGLLREYSKVLRKKSKYSSIKSSEVEFERDLEIRARNSMPFQNHPTTYDYAYRPGQTLPGIHSGSTAYAMLRNHFWIRKKIKFTCTHTNRNNMGSDTSFFI